MTLSADNGAEHFLCLIGWLTDAVVQLRTMKRRCATITRNNTAYTGGK